jgi:DNA-directed RNA polymerase subunit RPC12/RpoP
MDLLELLRSQARRYRCAACGKSMADCDINILAQQGNRALVRVTCTACSDENLLQIVFQGEGEAEADENAPAAQPRRRRPTIDEGRPEVPEPISSDELLDLHSMLRDFSGGFRELVGGGTV